LTERHAEAHDGGNWREEWCTVVDNVDGGEPRDSRRERGLDDEDGGASPARQSTRDFLAEV